MLAAAYLLTASLAGFALATRMVPTAPAIVRIPAGFLLAVVLTSWTTYLVAAGLSGQTPHSLRIGLIVSTTVAALGVAILGRRLRPRDITIPVLDALLALFALCVSWWFMNARLREESGDLVVSANTWGDLGLHGALSRSFSVGANYPTEYPFFAGEPIRYHFGFDFFAGMLQEGGFSLLWSFNLPAIVGFAAMMTITFAIARLLFSASPAPRWWCDRGVWAGFVAVALLLTNQSLGWLRYVEQDANGSLATALRPSVLWAHEGYATGGPYTDDRIVMFNTPNAYLTQTHLIVAMAFVLFLTYVVLGQLRGPGRPDRWVLGAVGVTFGVAFWLNGVVWLAAAVFLGTLLVGWGLAACRGAYANAQLGMRWPMVRRQALAWGSLVACFAVPALAIGVPQALLLNAGTAEGGLAVHLGYLTCSSTASSCNGGSMSPLSLADWSSFVQYWWLNHGAFVPLLVVAFAIGSGRDRKIIAATTFVFVWGNLIQVGQDVGGQNHKVFNLWENLAGPFVAFAVISIWMAGRRWSRRGTWRLRAAGGLTSLASVVLVGFLTISGLIDVMTVKNDFVVSVFGDQVQQEAMNWIITETEPDATFLTDYDQLYTAPTMAGRGIALGYSSWASSAGYDIGPRQEAIAAIYSAPDRATACSLLRSAGLDYVLVGPQEETSPRLEVNGALFRMLAPAATFGEAAGAYRIYRAADFC
ncbi:MAG: hypothetical protein WB471_14920 [Nocardioides sp.]